ncbi:MAG TPA: aldo/keto reductase [Albitalea sp.]|nr:aldo/keto reductase [Albitalea sp.]
MKPTPIEQRPFGTTGLNVSALGLGAGQLGDARLSEDAAGTLLNTALDLGVRLIDTAPSYGLSEERIGRHLRHRRSEFVLSTKVGYGIPGVPDWTYECIVQGIDRALARLQCERIDVVHLHSCDIATMQANGVMDALDFARSNGKIAVAAYSGENEALRFAAQSGRFQSIEASINLCDQKLLDDVLPLAQQRGLGVIAKRPVANAPWRFSERPVGDYAEEYWQRWKTMAIDAHGLDWQELALRFCVWHSGAHSAIVGTANVEHLRHNAELVARGPLPAEWAVEIRAAFARCGEHWVGQV